jgi:hypothetical protein
MRIPSYNEDVEEPWYWAFFGADLYTYSYFLDKYTRVSHNDSDYQQAMAAAAAVPPEIVQEFTWRRQRNFNATVFLLEAQAASVASGGSPLFRSIYITLDDNALFGFNIAESIQLRALVAQYNLTDTVLIYPGADEVGLSMLARLTVDAVAEAEAALDGGEEEGDGEGEGVPGPSFTLVFRKPDNASLHLVPNYEGQPMLLTLLDQIAAAGASAAGNWSALAVDGAWEEPGRVRPWRCASGACSAADLTWPRPAAAGSRRGGSLPLPTPILLVNNFGLDEFPQIEAPSQSVAGRSPADYAAFTPSACGSAGAAASVVSVADNRYSNGADVIVIDYLLQLAGDAACVAPAPTQNAKGLGLDRLAYAGWNTDGNTVGTAISNLVLLSYFADFGPYAGNRERLARRLDRAAARRRERAGTTTATAATGRSGGAGGARARASCDASCANSYFNTLRIVEDSNWQAGLRQSLVSYVSGVDGEDVDSLFLDLPFYERYAYKVLASRTHDTAEAFGAGWTLQEAYFPWNRTFEIGLVAA